MNFIFILAFCIFQRIEVVLLSVENNFECVKRKSGTCKAFNVSTDFDVFIEFKGDPISTIIEVDYMENKYSYQSGKKINENKVDTFDNPVVEILFSEDKDPVYSYRLVLGEKLNRLAYLSVIPGKDFIKYNNYSPDLPTWPFAINVTFDDHALTVYTRNGDGFDKPEPFLQAKSRFIDVEYMSVRNRDKNVKLVGFYDCTTKYGSSCGIERTQTITDCRAKFSPRGSGFFNTFVDMSKYNRLDKQNNSRKNVFEYNEIFGIHRRNNDSIHIRFSSAPYEQGTYVILTIGDEINVRVRTEKKDDDYDYDEKDAVKKGWNQEPSEPNFIRVKLSTVEKQISIYNIDDINANDDYGEKLILTMKLCNYFESESVRYMSVTSNHFYTVDLYFDCCLLYEENDCHVYEKNNAIQQGEQEVQSIITTTDNGEINTDSTTDNGEITTDSTTDNGEITTNSTTEFIGKMTDTIKIGEINYYPEGFEKTKIFLDTSDFSDVGSTQYVYETGTSESDYCPEEINEVGVELQEIEETKDDDAVADEEDSEYQAPVRGGLSFDALRALVG